MQKLPHLEAKKRPKKSLMLFMQAPCSIGDMGMRLASPVK